MALQFLQEVGITAFLGEEARTVSSVVAEEDGMIPLGHRGVFFLRSGVGTIDATEFLGLLLCQTSQFLCGKPAALCRKEERAQQKEEQYEPSVPHSLLFYLIITLHSFSV